MALRRAVGLVIAGGYIQGRFCLAVRQRSRLGFVLIRVVSSKEGAITRFKDKSETNSALFLFTMSDKAETYLLK